MGVYVPVYYSRFRCVAGDCRHTCCAGWQIDIDADTQAVYQKMKGASGEAIRASLVAHEGGVHFATDQSGRCVHLDGQGLCRIIAEGGEGMLCHICREHPRFYNSVAGHTLCGLGAVCETAAQLLLHEPDHTTLVCIDGGAAPLSLDDAALWPHAALFVILKNSAVPFDGRLAQIRQEFAGGLFLPSREWCRLFGSLEYLDKKNKKRFKRACRFVPGDVRQETAPEVALLGERFLSYLLFRHVMPTAGGRDTCLAVATVLVLLRVFLALLAMGMAPVVAARTVSEELEYSEDNMEAIRFALDLQLLG
ncbi:MAG: hypothetical protein E7639_01130 [Ruminococcaceae bacterium]|nr:hypothetical protein [Oscillospiraceae bacterium]